MNGKVKLSDVAEAAGVSAITVSRALRRPEMVSEALRLKIRQIVEEIGYVPDPAARALASARTDVIGVLIPSVTNNVFADVLRGIFGAAEGSSHHIQLADTRYSQLEEERLLRIFQSQRPAGLIVSGIDQSEASRAVMAELECPIVQIMEIGADPIDMMVGFSHRDASRAATRHMIEAGYRRIAFFGARMDPRTQRRLDGFLQEMREADLLDERLIVTTRTASSVGLGCAMTTELLSRSPDVDAIICNNDDLALGVLFECNRRRIAVPEGIGICGYNDFEMSAVAVPSLTSVRTHREEMGRRATEMLFDRIAGRDVPEPIVDLGFEVVVRRSTTR